jgi:hypothetical protein
VEEEEEEVEVEWVMSMAMVEAEGGVTRIDSRGGGMMALEEAEEEEVFSDLMVDF